MNMTAAEYRNHQKQLLNARRGTTNKSGKKKSNPDLAPKVPAYLVEGESFEVLGDELFSCEVCITPPSVNHYWIKGKNKTNRLSKRAVHFVEVMKRFIDPIGYQGPVSVQIEYAAPDTKIRDIDNIVKPCLDALSKGGLILDDSQVDELNVKRLPVVKGGKIVIHVERKKI